ncbi:MAG: hypothetical protein HY447_02835 [Candidatus Omnitrophica bacterium]|nr:hypothetical protein [Candidatus Omnitrophota bacterium]
MIRLNPAKILIFLGVLYSAYVCYALVNINEKLLSWWTLLDAAIFIALVTCVWGFWKSRPWAIPLSLVLALAGFGFGCYLAYFVWTFWLFEEPTLLDRIKNVLHPRVSVFLVFPVIWMIYFTRRALRV